MMQNASQKFEPAEERIPRNQQLCLVLEGGVGAGKTHLLQRLQNIFSTFEAINEEGKFENVAFVPEPSFNEIKLCNTLYDPLHETYSDNSATGKFVCTQMHIFQTLMGQAVRCLKENENSEMVIYDRIGRSCEVFIKMRHQMGLISQYESDFLVEYLHIWERALTKHRHGKVFTRVFFLDTSPEKCLENIKKRNRQEEIILSNNFWLEFNQQYKASFLEVFKDFDIRVSSSPEEIISQIMSLRQPQAKEQANKQEHGTHPFTPDIKWTLFKPTPKTLPHQKSRNAIERHLADKKS